MINSLIRPLGYENGIELLKSLFLTSQQHLYIFLFSFFTVAEQFIEKFVWAEAAQYWFLIMLIIVDFVTGVLKAMKFKMFVPKKLPRVFIVMIAYTLLMYISFYGARVVPLLFWLPTALYSLFVLMTLLSIAQNMYALNFIPKVIKNFFENKIGYQLNQSLNIEINDASLQHKAKIQTLITQLLYVTNASKVLIIKFKNEFFGSQIGIFGEVVFEKINTTKIGKVSSTLGNVENSDKYEFILAELQLRDYLVLDVNKIENSFQKNVLKTFGATDFISFYRIDGVETDSLLPFLVVVHDNYDLIKNDTTKIRTTLNQISLLFNKIKMVEDKKNKGTGEETLAIPTFPATPNIVENVTGNVSQNEEITQDIPQEVENNTLLPQEDNTTSFIG